MKTQITVFSDEATSLSSMRHGANVSALAFNLMFIARRKPALAAEIYQLWKEADQLTVDMPEAPHEDLDLAMGLMAKIYSGSQRHKSK